MAIWSKINSKDTEQSFNPENVNINKDGIVSLNLKNENVQKKINEQIAKLKLYEDKLVSQ